MTDPDSIDAPDDQAIARAIEEAAEVPDAPPPTATPPEAQPSSAGGNEHAKGKGPKPADLLIAIAEACELFCTRDGTAYADVPVDGHRETWAVRSTGFRRWLVQAYLGVTTNRAPSGEALQTALNAIDARADGTRVARTVHLRAARADGKLYVDLCDAAWRAVEVDAAGWRIVDEPPVRFVRSAAMLPLPVPERGGSIDLLREFLNVGSEGDFVLAVSWLLMALRDGGPYPVLVVTGEQGTAKSTFSELMRALVDPNVAPLRAPPRDKTDIAITADNAHFLAYDNISSIQSFISDALCRISTGGGDGPRKLYTVREEALFHAVRPVILNGIENFATRGDLASRALLLTLQPIGGTRRRTKEAVMAQFEAVRPRILGALLDALSVGLSRHSAMPEQDLPRMADFAKWAAACETALWRAGTFVASYRENIAELVESAIEADPVAAAVRAMMARRERWQGIAAQLLDALTPYTSERIAKSKDWPTGPRAMGGRLRRAAPNLRAVGIEVEHGRAGHRQDRTIYLTAARKAAGADDADGADGRAGSFSGSAGGGGWTARL